MVENITGNFTNVENDSDMVENITGTNENITNTDIVYVDNMSIHNLILAPLDISKDFKRKVIIIIIIIIFFMKKDREI